MPATTEGKEGKGWCATSTGSDGVFELWDYCIDPKCGAAAAPATGGTDALIGCASCVAFGVVPSAIYCATNGTDIGETILKKFDASCLIKKCICAVLISTGAIPLINVLGMMGLCVRPTPPAW